jgi:hypothetical protein
MQRYAYIVTVGVALTLTFLLIKDQIESPKITITTSPVNELSPHTHDIERDALTDTSHHSKVRAPVFIPDRDLYVTRIEFAIHNAPAVTVHHAGLFSVVDSSSTSTDGIAEYIINLSSDQFHTPFVTFPSGYALKIPRGTPLVFEAMLHNPLPPVGPGENYRNVSISITLHEGTGTHYRPVVFRQLSLIGSDDCRLSDSSCTTFVVPPHVSSYVFRGNERMPYHKTTLTRAGHIVHMGAHVHGWEGGKLVRLLKNGNIVAEFNSTQSPVTPFLYTTPHYDTNIAFRAGDEFSIEAISDNNTDSPIRGAMGIVGMYVAYE